MKLKRKQIDIKCIDAMELLRTIPNSSVDLILTDPPYKTTPRGNAGNTGGMLKTERFSKGRLFDNMNVTVKDYAPEFYRVLKVGSHCYVMCNHRNLIEMLNVFTDCGFHFCKSLIWEKGNKITSTFYMNSFEYILFFYKEKGIKINNCGTPDLLHIPNKKTKDENGKNLHDTEKPIELMKILIENSTQERQLVLDPFLDIGSTAIACKNTNRRFIGSEIDKHYFDIAKIRIEE